MPPTEPTPAPIAEGTSPAPAAVIEQAPVVPVSAAPAPAAAPTPVAATQPAKPDLSKLSREDRLAIALGRKPAVTPAPAPAPATPAAPPADPAAQPVPAAGDEAHKLPDRFRFTSEDDQMVALLAKRENIGLIEAARRYDALRNPGAIPAPAAAPAAPAAPNTPPPAPVVAPEVARVAEIDADIAKKRADVKKLREEMEHEKADDLMVEIASLTGEKQLLAAEAKRNEQQAAQSFEGAVMASRDRVFAQFPEFGDPTSLEHMALIGFVTMEQAKPENQALFKQPDFPEKIFAAFRQKQGVKAGAAKPAVQSPATPPAPAPAAVVPAPVVTRPQAKQVPAYGADGRLLTTAAGIAPVQREMSPQDAITASRSDPKLRAALRQAVLRRPATTTA